MSLTWDLEPSASTAGNVHVINHKVPYRCHSHVDINGQGFGFGFAPGIILLSVCKNNSLALLFVLFLSNICTGWVTRGHKRHTHWAQTWKVTLRAQMGHLWRRRTEGMPMTCFWKGALLPPFLSHWHRQGLFLERERKCVIFLVVSSGCERGWLGVKVGRRYCDPFIRKEEGGTWHPAN